jgi:hypothetical protein
MTVVAVCAALALSGPASAAAVTFGSGHLDWGVKESFRNYITGPIAQGSYTASSGATKLSEPNGRIRFNVLGGPYDTGTRVGSLSIDGTVHFEGHGGTLDMTMENVRIALAGATGTLYADVTSKDMTTGDVEHYPGVAFADLTVSAPVATATGLTWSSIPAKLTAEGAPAFGGFYTAGDDIDPLAPLTANFGAPSEEPPTPKPTQPTSRTPVIKELSKAISVKGSRPVRIAVLRCGDSSCTVKAPKKVKVKIKGKRYKLEVLFPKAIKAGGAGKLRVKLPKAARKALAGRRAKVKVKVEITASGKLTVKRVKATLKAKATPQAGGSSVTARKSRG